MSSQTGTVSSVSVTGSWTNASNIYTSNNTYAVSASIASSGVTGFLTCTGNGFSIPTGATIAGIEVAVEGKNQISANGFSLRPQSGEARIWYAGAAIGSGNPSGITNQTWTTNSDQTKTFGDSTNLWGAALTPSIINDSTFGFRCRFFNNNASSQTFSVDCISMTVHYTDSAGIQSSQQLFMYEG
jgi:hypothetical protein